MRFTLAVLLVWLFVPLAIAQSSCPANSPCTDLNRQIMGSRLPSWGVDSGSANAYAITTMAFIGSGGVLQTGASFFFAAAHANTGASTLNVDSTGAIAIKKIAAGSFVDLASGDIAAGQIHIFWYDGTRYQCVTCAVPSASPSGTAGGDLSGTYPNPSVVALHLSPTPSECSAGNYARGIDTNGNARDCTADAGGGGGGGGSCSSGPTTLVGSAAASNATPKQVSATFTCSGSLVVLAVSSESAATDPLTVTGTGAACPASWTLAAKNIANANVAWVYYGQSQAAGGCVISTNVSGSFPGTVEAEFSNANASVDKSAVFYSSGTSSITTTLPALSSTNDLVVSFIAGFHTGWTTSPTAPLTSIAGFVPVHGDPNEIGWYKASSASAQSLTWGITCCGSTWWDDNVIVNVAFATSTGSTVYYQTVQEAGTARTQRPILNCDADLNCVDDSGNNSTDVHLKTTGVTAGSCGDGTHSCGLTIDNKGRITSQSNNTISGTGGSGFALVQHDVTGSRSNGTTFQNTTGATMLIGVMDAHNSTGTAFAKSDSSSTPTTVVAEGSDNGGFVTSIFFAVPNNNYYVVTCDTGCTLQHWIEWY